MTDQQDISHESVSIGRMLDRKPPGRYFLIIDKPRRDTGLGWDVEILSLEKGERHALMRRNPELGPPRTPKPEQGTA